ncbi:MAG: MotA/TolQ/ExbB proton channel family protein [Verrucomicrobiales bacterium]|nr:MotA/TolQ/ExbB proton channel family protein [Verrucomicrobiales bacterium]
MKLILTTLLIILTSCDVLIAQEPAKAAPDLDKVLVGINADLNAALKELADQRAAIAKEKIPLAKTTNQLSADLRETRRLADLAKVSREAAAEEVAKHEGELKAWRDEKNYLESLFLDFRKSYEAVNSLPRVEASRETLNQADFEGRSKLITETLNRLNAAEAVSPIPGSALSEEGVLVEGTFAEVGPISWFVSADKKLAGLVTTGDQLQPEVVTAGNSAESIEALLNGEEAGLTFDPTLGSALAMVETKPSLIEHIGKGGFWIYPILFLGLIALLVAIGKWLQLSRIREVRPAAVQSVIDALNRDKVEEAREQVSAMKHPSRKILTRGIDAYSEDKSVSREDLEEQLFERFLESQPPLQSWLPLIAIASATAPLLGLLGTVTGMIETFRMINIFGTGDAKSLASGISEALVTTEFGLVVAIPALILHALLSRKVSAVKANMEMTSLAFLNGIDSSETK